MFKFCKCSCSCWTLSKALLRSRKTMAALSFRSRASNRSSTCRGLSTLPLTWKVKTTLPSFAASTKLECEREEQFGCLSSKKKKKKKKKKEKNALSSPSYQWAAEEVYITGRFNKGLCVGPSLGLIGDTRSTDLIQVCGQTRAFTSHSWLSNSKSSCCDTTGPCMALHGQTFQSATESPCQDFAWSYPSICQRNWSRKDANGLIATGTTSQWTDAGHTIMLVPST